MAESILYSSARKILETLASIAGQEICLAWGLESDLRRLKTTLSSIKAVILDAEEQQTVNNQITNWLSQLRSALYDAEDVLDDFQYQLLLKKVINTYGSTKKKVRRFFSSSNSFAYRLRIGHQIKDLRRRLDQIAADKAQFNLVDRLDMASVQLMEREMTHSFVNPSDIIGRDGDREAIVEFLMDSHQGHASDNNVEVRPEFSERPLLLKWFSTIQGWLTIFIQNCGCAWGTHFFSSSSNIVGRERDREAIEGFVTGSRQGHSGDDDVAVMPIVGIGGLGKTALAKMVFNDPRVVHHFGKKLWVCLGDMKEFDVNQVMAKIGGEMNVGASNSEQLQQAIRDNLQDKTFLLILDDVWDVNRDKWLTLKSFLTCGCRSKIILTTRSDQVASGVNTLTPYILQGLPHKDSISLFKKLAFASESRVDEKLMKIGENIVKKCKGVPLAIRSLGSMLFKESDESKWLALRDNSIWQIEEGQKTILPILKFSYDYLPCHLKQCFVYCSIFPEDYEFEAQSLLTFWMAHGLLQSPDINQKSEDVGKQYIKELLSRGFFQDSKERGLGYGWTFKMHDLVRDLASLLGQGEFLIVNENNREIAENVRHVRFGRQDCSRNSSNVIRTVFASSSNVLTKAWIYQFKCLRFLRLELPDDVKELPDTIGSLKHLRSLDLSKCSSLERLPDSITKLHHLQSLNLSGCLSLEELPEKIEELISLRYLSITTQQNHWSANNTIECFPSLQYLAFSGCDQLETLFGRTENLTLSLRTLVVENCTSLVSLFPLSGSWSTNYSLAALEVLYIDICINLNLYFKVFKNGEFLDVSERLHLPRLRSLTITFVDLTEGLPEWIHGCAPTLRFFEICGCGNLEELPEWLPNLSSLHTLKIKFFSELKALPQGMERLTALKTLTIIDCPMLLERCDKERGEDWPKIAHVPNILIK